MKIIPTCLVVLLLAAPSRPRQRINTMRDERGYLSADELINAALDALPGQAIQVERRRPILRRPPSI